MENKFFVIEWNTEGDYHVCGCGFKLIFCGSKIECEEYIKNNCKESYKEGNYWYHKEYKIIESGYSELWE